MAAWVVALSDQHGVLKGIFATAQIESIIREVRQPRKATFTIPTLDPAAALLNQGAQYEARIWRDGVLRFAGPVWTPVPNGPTTRVDGQDPVGYLARRFFGTVGGRHNYLTNPIFQNDAIGAVPASWTPSGAGLTAAVVADTIRGPHSVRLTQPTAGVDSYLAQQVTYTAPAGPTGIAVTLKAWFVIETWNGAAGPNSEARGVFMQALDPGTGLLYAGTQPDFYPITASTPQGKPQPGVCQVVVPAGATVHLDCRLYGLESVRYGGLQMVVEESLSTDQANGEDQAVTMRRIVDYAQGRAPFSDPYKTDLNIALDHPATDTAAGHISGVTRIQSFQFAEAAETLASLDTYGDNDDGIDWSCVIQDTATRVFTVYGRSVADGATTAGSNVLTSAAGFVQDDIDSRRRVVAPTIPAGTYITAWVNPASHAAGVIMSNNALSTGSALTVGIGGRKGSYKPDCWLRSGLNVSQEGSSVPAIGPLAATAVRYLSDSASSLDQDATREEGGAVASGYAVELERVVKAKTGTPIHSLDSLARQELANYLGSGQLPVLQVLGEYLYDNLGEGDVVDVDYEYGWQVLTGRWRVVKIEETPLQGAVMKVTLSPAVPM